METILQQHAIPATKQTTVSKSLVKSDFWERAEFNRFGISPTFLTIVVCLSAFAGAYAIQDSMLAISIVGFPTAIFISSIIAIKPMKMIFAMTAITILIDLVVIAMHLI